jgi:glycogen debranching enzyme
LKPRFATCARRISQSKSPAVRTRSATSRRSASIWRLILAAGIPWFCAPFGRDALLTASQSLLVNPSLAKDSLRVLAAYQGKRFDEHTEEEPGKIFHELRFGEMAQTRETPHTPYYGSIDATPLFVIVADATYQVTADGLWLRQLQAAVESALAWIDARSGAGTHFVTYRRQSARGLDNQGWKDSRAAVAYPDGRLAAAPIALCEIQGYCADAYRRGARLLAELGKPELAERYAARAKALRALTNEHFWLPELGRYAYALDADGKAVDTVVSNLGHLLWSRIPDEPCAGATADLLLRSESFSGFGIRTLAAGQAAYNPLSYHNGTVWPHDNSIIAKGMANYGYTSHATDVFEGLIAAMHYFRDHRLPELFCGMPREAGDVVRYPVACSPQAWAAGAPFLLLQSVLGIHADAPRRKLSIRNACLPPSIEWCELDNLRVGSSRVRVRFRRADKRVHVDALEISGAHLRTEIAHE